MFFITPTKSQRDRLRNGDFTLLKQLLKQEEKVLHSRILSEKENFQRVQGAGVFLENLLKLVDPSGITSELSDTDTEN